MLTRLLAAGFLPVVSPLAADDAGNLLNVNADGVAAALAVALGAAKLVLLTDVPGLLERADDPRSLVSLHRSRRACAGCASAASSPAAWRPRPRRSRPRCAAACERAHVVSWRAPDGLLAELFTNEGSGTLVVAELAALTRGRAGRGSRRVP